MAMGRTNFLYLFKRRAFFFWGGGQIKQCVHHFSLLFGVYVSILMSRRLLWPNASLTASDPTFAAVAPTMHECMSVRVCPRHVRTCMCAGEHVCRFTYGTDLGSVI